MCPVCAAPIVAPTTGAWIETVDPWDAGALDVVAPTTGAWIETLDFCKENPTLCVAPTTGAWIETDCMTFISHSGTSLPPRERGLKLLLLESCSAFIVSLPPRERGLKR